ncbi:Serine acetyltransferase [Lachnospiraceae bacterium TWA4]|nr:Serine acetyltransferase [Lachnospiraceae bacterium TWA4]
MAEKIEKQIHNLVEDILEDYGHGRAVDKINKYTDPDKEVIIDIINKMQKIIFPGYFRDKKYRSYTATNNVYVLVEDVLYNLSKQIAKVLKYITNNSNIEENKKQAECITLKFLHQIPKIREYIDSDVQAAFDGDPAAFNKDEIILSYPGLYAIMVHRIAHELHKLCVPLIPRIMSEHAHSLTGIDIHPGATIGRYFFIDHGTGIVIGETTIIGDHVKIYQGVTLGALSTRGGQSLKDVKRHPTIEDNVTIYSGASILGGDTVISKDVVVGGNVFITSSVSEGIRVSAKTQELNYSGGLGIK